MQGLSVREREVRAPHLSRRASCCQTREPRRWPRERASKLLPSLIHHLQLCSFHVLSPFPHHPNSLFTLLSLPTSQTHLHFTNSLTLSSTRHDEVFACVSRCRQRPTSGCPASPINRRNHQPSSVSSVFLSLYDANLVACLLLLLQCSA